MLATRVPKEREQLISTIKSFAERVLSRHISSSNVLVVASDAVSLGANESQKKIPDPTTATIGGLFLAHAAAEGHDIHAVDFGLDGACVEPACDLSLDSWWKSFLSPAHPVRPRNWFPASTKSLPKWIIATVVDTTDSIEKTQLMDSVWKWKAESLLSEATMTYVVVTLHAWKSDEVRTIWLCL